MCSGSNNDIRAVFFDFGFRICYGKSVACNIKNDRFRTVCLRSVRELIIREIVVSSYIVFGSNLNLKEFASRDKLI